jgi:aquaporin Z
VNARLHDKTLTGLEMDWCVISLTKKCSAEFFGTFWLSFGGCGSAVLAAGYPIAGIGWLGVALAFGLTLLMVGYWR